MQTVLAILQVAAGLGFVIFVHELGHFLVAKACGVRCDKFMVGFDIGGMKVGRQWGETYYGIGVLPLGGYVKMFGQDDNVQNIAEEMEKSKALEGSPDAKEVMGPDGKTMWIDKRSYMAKSVPQRMAIISAGVIMNVIFAVIMAWVAFGLGVPETPAVVGATVNGGAAWKAGLHTGDRLTEINDIKNPNYDQFSKTVILGNLDEGLKTSVESPDGSTRTITLRPEMQTMAPRVGVLSTQRLRLSSDDAVQPNTPAAAAGDQGFQDGDQIVEVDGKAIETYTDLLTTLQQKKSEPLSYTVIRGGKAPLNDPFGKPEGGERVTFEIAPNPMERLGIVPTLGPIVALEAGSPAEEAGLKEGDVIVLVDGVSVGDALDGEEAIDPVTLEDRFAVAASEGRAIELGVDRGGDEPVTIEVTPRVVTWQSTPDLNSPFVLNAIGVACDLRAEVAAIVGGSPAADTDLRPGDRIVSMTTKSTIEDDNMLPEPLTFGEAGHNWPLVLSLIQDNSSSFEVELEVARPAMATSTDEPPTEASTRKITLKPAPVEDQFTAARGIKLEPLKRLKVAESLGEQTELAFAEVGDQLMSVVHFLQKIGSQVSVKALGGPITIAQHAGKAAFEGVGALLMSLVMLSANLAILNFLPIPVLDGGHMVFLMYEGITGRPANERVMIALQMVGLLLLLSLMLFVFTLDISRLFGIQL